MLSEPGVFFLYNRSISTVLENTVNSTETKNETSGNVKFEHIHDLL